MTTTLRLLLCAVLTVPVSGCAPEVGSEEWCAMMDEKPKGEWTANEASAYTQHCIF